MVIQLRMRNTTSHVEVLITAGVEVEEDITEVVETIMLLLQHLTNMLDSLIPLMYPHMEALILHPPTIPIPNPNGLNMATLRLMAMLLCP